MMSSMTGFARKIIVESWGSLVCEIRSVNQRYLETQFRLDDEIRELEPYFRECLRQSISRGKVECHIKMDLSPSSKNDFDINKPLAKKIIEAAKWVQNIADEGSVNPIDILNWPGVVISHSQNLEEVHKVAKILFSKTLKSFIEMRQREGEQIRHILVQKLDSIAQEVESIRAFSPIALQWQRDRLLQKLNEIKLQAEHSRLELELLLLANKSDVSEELDRLDIHITETRSILLKPEPIGRRLDFMMQEFNREANTLGSKSIKPEITQSAIEIKILIEQMREQIQNIE
ncbi:YicC/YloC family endoribonuclease [Thorsellia anophelis]|nr:YicC/YloC family endoribonuclease [Thorsellia anophelis]